MRKWENLSLIEEGIESMDKFYIPPVAGRKNNICE
jgi:hypothetical protein